MPNAMSTPTASVLTIASGRQAHLANIVRGLMQQTVQPEELVVARMQPQPFLDLPQADFPVLQIRLHVPEEGLPLAAARNAAAKAAIGDHLLFLDVDCIPSPSFVADYLDALEAFDGVLMGEVKYLPKGVAERGWTFRQLDAKGVRHSDRRGPPAHGIEPCPDYRCFWSLNFALSAQTFAASGGFDEAFLGYGGEDTDFGKSVVQKGIPLAWLNGALSYHQFHTQHMPPVHNLHSVVRNAELFERKWGYRTMGHWLHAFHLLGLIDNRPEGIRILRDPEPADLDLTRQYADEPYVNTASVIRAIEAGAARRLPMDRQFGHG